MMNSELKEKHKNLFEAISESVSIYGTEGLEFILKTHKEPINVDPDTDNAISNLFSKIDKAIDKYGIDYVIYLIQNKKNNFSNEFYKLKHTDKLNNKVFEIVSRIFEVSKENIINASNRDGKRVLASGTIVKIFSEVFDYSINEIMLLIPKSKPILSRHKIMVSNLDYKHPTQQPMLKRYLFCKHEIINFIINQDGKE